MNGNKDIFDRGIMDTKTIKKWATAFQKQSQLMTAQPGDIEHALKAASLWEIAPQVSPLLDGAGVPDNAAVHIAILLSPGPNVAFNAVIDPQNSNVSKKLNMLLQQKFGAAMKNVLTKAKLNVDSTLVVNWLNF